MLCASDPPTINNGDPMKLHSYENIEARVSYSEMYEFEEKPRKSYAIENSYMNQLDFPINEMMFLTTQYKVVNICENRDDFSHMKLRFHAVLAKEQEEVGSLVKLVQALGISKGEMRKYAS